jgi:hypothetical protein
LSASNQRHSTEQIGNEKFVVFVVKMSIVFFFFFVKFVPMLMILLIRKQTKCFANFFSLVVVIQQFLHAQTTLVGEQRRAEDAARRHKTELAESRELEQSATQVNNLLRQKLESQKAKLELQQSERAAIERQLDERLAELSAARQQIAALSQQLAAAAAAAHDDDDDDDAPRHSVDQRTMDDVSKRLAAYTDHNDHNDHLHNHNSNNSNDSNNVNNSRKLNDNVATTPTTPTGSGGSALATTTGSVLGGLRTIWEWARPSEPSVAGFQLDARAFAIHERRGSRKASAVCRATLRATSEQVALKNVQNSARLREVMLLAKMRHRSLLRCDAVAFGAGQVCCAVLRPYAPFDLQYALNVGRLAPAQLGVVVRQLLDAVAYLHSGDVVHANIQAKTTLVAPDGRIVLSNFT